MTGEASCDLIASPSSRAGTGWSRTRRGSTRSSANMTYSAVCGDRGRDRARSAVEVASRLDAVGWGDATNAWSRGLSPAPGSAAGSSIERRPGGPLGSSRTRTTTPRLLRACGACAPRRRPSRAPRFRRGRRRPRVPPPRRRRRRHRRRHRRRRRRPHRHRLRHPHDADAEPESDSDRNADRAAFADYDAAPAPVARPRRPSPTPTPTTTPAPTPAPRRDRLSGSDSRRRPVSRLDRGRAHLRRGSIATIEGVLRRISGGWKAHEAASSRTRPTGSRSSDAPCDIPVRSPRGCRATGSVDTGSASGTLRTDRADVTVLGEQWLPTPLDVETGGRASRSRAFGSRRRRDRDRGAGPPEQTDSA